MKKIFLFTFILFTITIYSQDECVDSSLINYIPDNICLNDSIDNYQIYIDPVCGCDSITYVNEECARLSAGVSTVSTGGGCSCIDSSYIEYKNIDLFPNLINLVCGCDGKTYINKWHALFLGGVTKWTEGSCDCVFEELIDTTIDCSQIIHIQVPVCGCDTITYKSPCEAYYYHGITSLEIDECPCVRKNDIDTTIQCADIYEPVCGCDTVTYKNACIAKNHFGISKFTNGKCPCLDSTLINIDTLFKNTIYDSRIYKPVCGCDSITYYNKYYAKYLYGIIKSTRGACKCIDSTYIDTNVVCTDLYQPIIGCDGNYYKNFCIAQRFHGVMDYSFINCQTDQQIDSTIECYPYFNYDPVCGCDNITYHNKCEAKYKGGVVYWIDGVCDKDSCIDKTLINSLQTCTEEYDPVCGCDSITYTNECIAKYRYGIRNYTKGKCKTNKIVNLDNIKYKPIIYPNPVIDEINILFSENNLPQSIIFVDVLGKAIKRVTISSKVKNYKINTENILSGVYFIISKTNKKTYYNKIIKN